MAVLNSNLKRFLLIASLLLSACSNLQSTANDLIENSGIQNVADASESTDETSNAASAAQGEEEALLQVTPTLSAPSEPTVEPPAAEEAAADDSPTPTEEPVEATPTEEPTEEPTAEPSPTPEATPTELPPAEPTPLPVSISSQTADMLLINGGEFEMGAEAAQLLEACNSFREGCDLSWFQSSEPIHMVQVDPFYIDAYEVTNEAFIEFLNELDDVESGCAGQLCFDIEDSQLEIDEDGQYLVDEAYFEHPVTGATWYGASAFCEWRDTRLPTEAEWELAASWDSDNGVKNFYPWGDEFDGTRLNFCDINCEETQASSEYDDGFAFTAPVGSYEDGRTPSGIYDMGGNVWEWVNDWLGDDYYGQSPDTNPPGPDQGDGKVVRGGSWIDTGNFSATTVRFPAPPEESGNSIGFRCAVDAIPAEEVLAQVPEEETTADETSDEATAKTSDETSDEAAEETTDETVEEVAEETSAETAEEVTKETTDETAGAAEEVAEEVTDETEEVEEAATVPVSINCNFRPGVDNGSTYIVGACDWLEKIAIRLGVSYHALLAANPQIDDPNLIFPGQVLNVPPRNGQGNPPPAPGGGQPNSPSGGQPGGPPGSQRPNTSGGLGN